MKYVLASVCAMMLMTVEAHLRQLLPMAQFPGSTPLQDTFWTGPSMLRRRINNVHLPQEVRNNFGQWPQTWGTYSAWNSGISPVRNDAVFNNNVLTSKDPWEQYRKFNSGMKRLSGTNKNQLGGQATNIVPVNQLTPGFVPANQLTPGFVPANQLTPGFVNNNYPWNTFATQNQNANMPGFATGLNQGFVSPRLQSNSNTGFINNQFQNQGFPNTLATQNGVFV